MKDWTQNQRNCFYKTQDVHPGNHRVTTDRCGWIKTKHNVWRPTSYLDVACRDGYVTRGFLEQGCYVDGVDINTEAIRLAEEEAQRHCKAFAHRAHYYERDLLSFDPDHNYDVVLCFEFIEHVPAKLASDVMMKMHSWSKHICAISTPNESGRYGTANAEDEGHINLYTPDRLRRDILKSTEIRESQLEVEVEDDFLYAWWTIE